MYIFYDSVLDHSILVLLMSYTKTQMDVNVRLNSSFIISESNDLLFS
jgi:hypothetical protein